MGDFADAANHWVKIKESEKRDKHSDLARELRKPWNTRMTVIPVIIGTLGTISKGLEKGLKWLEIGGGIVIVQTTAFLRSARIPRRVLGT